MVAFFNSHFPSRIMYLFLIMAFIVGGYLLVDFPFSTIILKWFIEGEKQSNGNFFYRDIWSATSPFFAFFERLISIFGRNTRVFVLLGGLLIFFQAIYFGIILNEFKILKNKSYLPSLFYVLFVGIHLELVGFTPEVLGMTFVLLSFRNLLSMNSIERYEKVVLNIGILLGIAVLCSPVYFITVLVTLVGISYFSTVNLRNIILLILGVLLPFIVVSAFFIAFDGFEKFYSLFILNLFHLFPSSELNYSFAARIILIPSFFMLIGILYSFSSSQSSNFIGKVKQLVFIWLILNVAFFAIYYAELSISMLTIFAPLVSFYVASYFIDLKKQFTANVMLLLFTAGTIGTGFYYQNQVYYENKVHLKEMPNDVPILIMGASIEEYENVQYGTSFVNPEDYMYLFEAYSKQNAIKIYKAFLVKTPVYVYDDELESFSKTIERIPLLHKKYSMVREGVYKLNK